MKLIKPGDKMEPFGWVSDKSLFLAGSIEQGSASNWQEEACKYFEKRDIEIYNPRRDNWDAKWKQTVENKQFRYQVEWEVSHLEKCRTVLFWFEGGTQSPITLLEFGKMMERIAWQRFPHKQRVVVGCHKDFWRRGNIEVMCYTAVPLYDNLQETLSGMGSVLDDLRLY